MALRPLQQPHPPFWYGSSNTIGATWAGEHGPAFRHPRADRGQGQHRRLQARRSPSAAAPAQPKPEFPGGAAIGVQRHIFVAETDEEARRFAKPAMEAHVAHLKWLRDRHGGTGLTSRLNLPRGADYRGRRRRRHGDRRHARQVLIEIERQAGTLGINYLLTYLFLGNMTLADALRSLRSVRTEVMPHLANVWVPSFPRVAERRAGDPYPRAPGL